MEIEPFKIRDEMRGKVLFEAAKECFGEPNMRSVVNSKTVMSWHLMDNFHQHTITAALSSIEWRIHHDARGE